MKNYLKIQSKGSIENEALSLIGASTKKNDKTKIGFYGSGLKYSISALLRNGIEFKIFSSQRQIQITTKETLFRGQDFKTVIIDGESTSLTTTMGGDAWDKPFAPIREIYSNALDEDEDTVLEMTTETEGRENKTTFLIEATNEVIHFYDNIKLYFCNHNPNVLHANEYAAFYPQTEDETLRLFRKNILCLHKDKEKALFSYNSSQFEINESRVLDSEYDAKNILGGAWKKCDNENLIQQLINGLQGGNDGYFEHHINYGTYRGEFSEAWKTVMLRDKFVPVEILSFCSPEEVSERIALPMRLLKPLLQKFPEIDILGLSSTGNDDENFLLVEKPSQILVNKVIDALDVLRRTNYKYRMDNVNIEYVKFTKTHVLGLAKDDKIYLSEKLDTYDVNAIAKIIIEENEHNRSGFGDETREFQNHLFDLYFDSLKGY
jgi:hypothetical protein